jgi:hypothetical protein
VEIVKVKSGVNKRTGADKYNNKLVVQNPTFPVSDSKNSETVFCKTSLCMQKRLVVCDTPGFNDTGGFEMDITNAIGITATLRRCRSVRFVILISFSQIIEPRCRSLCDLMKIMSGFMENFEECMQATQILFTQCDKDEQTLEKIDSCFEHLVAAFTSELADPSADHGSETPEEKKHLVLFCQKALDAAAHFESMVIKPADDSAEATLELLHAFKPIENPADSFSTPLSQPNRTQIATVGQ